MPRARGLALAAALLHVTAGRGARADDDDTAIAINLGWGSAVGFGGLTLTRALSAGVRVEAGVGGGLTGIQLSLMPKIAWGAGRDRFVLGAGVSSRCHAAPRRAMVTRSG
jgi:hypothetical protein